MKRRLKGLSHDLDFSKVKMVEDELKKQHNTISYRTLSKLHNPLNRQTSFEYDVIHRLALLYGFSTGEDLLRYLKTGKVDASVSVQAPELSVRLSTKEHWAKNP